MNPTKEQIEKARDKMPPLGSVNKTNVYEWFILHGETILSCLTPPEPAASEGEVAKLRRTIEHLEADRKLAVEGLGQAQIDAMQAYNAQGTNECGAVLEDSIQSINEALSKLTASKRNNSAEKE